MRTGGPDVAARALAAPTMDARTQTAAAAARAILMTTASFAASMKRCRRVRADYVAADTPSVRIAAVDHLLHTEADLVERRHVPARMVESRPVRFREREHVMVARMRTVHERDEFA